ncbi:MAG: recombination mediator RecR [Eubacteriales bacterium]|jgi:recombination protein RecR|nr:recombination mediator RecR [Eubacteriales bacterium]MCI6979989.1 recombination mediator RecR [Clostridiales bacterium]MDD6721780.1 recombination mediator RecR [Clostridiales bacterium]MDY5693469.1 recombination mediator RecR [Eubacteriales bacterium]HZK44843.1 recombination mediator RecR [Clostridia bacterium]
MSIEPINTLCAQLAKLPGVGSKSAQRLAYFILDMPASSAKELAEAIIRAKDTVRYCPICGNYTDVEPCAICTDEKRSDDVICVVEDPKEVFAMEKLREYRGRYHVLHGAISPTDGIGPGDIRIKELIERVDKGSVHEVILATNPDVKGEATASYIARILKPKGVRVTRIAHGVPIGGNLEYVDEMTLLKAVEGRRDM